MNRIAAFNFAVCLLTFGWFLVELLTAINVDKGYLVATFFLFLSSMNLFAALFSLDK